MTFIRVFVNQDSTEMFTRLFKKVFAIFEELIGYKVQWFHLHNAGFKTMVMDMDAKQFSGMF